MKKTTLLNKMDKIRKKAINATANVISGPAQIKSALVQRRAKKETNIIKRARAYDDDTRDEAVFARTDARIVKDKIAKRSKKVGTGY